MKDEVKVVASTDGITMKVVDGTHVSLLQLDVDASAFTEYDCTGPTEFGLEVSKFIDALRFVKLGDLVSLEYDDGGINIQTPLMTRVLRGLDPTSMVDPAMPKLDFEGTATISAEWFKQATNQAHNVGDLVHLNHEGEMFGVEIRLDNKGETGEGMTAKTIAEPRDPECSQTYSLAYLKPIAADAAKITGKEGEVKIQFQNEYPLLMEWNSGTYGTEYTYLLAPRIEND
jgi:DNA polymerase III sliding clamp (beta) subunit (PCNA family)